MTASAETTTRRGRKRGTPRGSHHLDRRADQIAAAAPPSGDDDLLTIRELCRWLGVSESWLESMRARGLGPPWERLGERMVRYQRGRVRAWLRERGARATRREQGEATR
jgi:predicted DNA-binding transcriptional regulator AlpA